ncbi:MAG TPA: glycosyltransferase [Candidatus Saccharimonadales bacterium]|nr:glycosyltransferase [Candidatus Saccharimonadales bacterium]
MSNEALFIFFRNITIVLATVMLVKYFVFLMLAAWFPVHEQLRRIKVLRREKKKFGRIRPYMPLVSVVVPAWNEEVGIMRTIKSILANGYRNVEIVVVNDGSTDDSRMIVEDFITRHGAAYRKGGRDIRHYYKPNGGKGAALNYGIKHCKGDIILTMDADSALAPDALSKLVEYFRDPHVSAVVGQVRVANTKGRLVGNIQKLEYLFGFYFKRSHCVMGAEYIYGGACAAFRRKSTFEYFGLFDEKNKTEDIEMSMRTKFHGLRSIFAEDVICYTEGAASYMGLINQRLRWKKGRFDTFLHYRRMFFSLDKRHNKPLSWFILPYTMLSEIQLLLEPIGATLLITYSLLSSDFVSLSLSMLFVGISYLVVATFGVKMSFKERLRLLFLWPITWPLFYIVVWVEFLALLRSLHMVVRGDALEWQHWKREGI